MPRRLIFWLFATAIILFTERPAYVAANNTWKLSSSPTRGLECFRNGLFQTPNYDYTLSSNILISVFWLPDDLITCVYMK